MKTWLPNHMAIDTLFRNKLEKLPVDLSGKALHWQLVKQQLPAATPSAGVRPVSISPIIGGTVAGLLLLIVGIQQAVINDTTVPDKTSAIPATMANASDTATGSSGQESPNSPDTTSFLLFQRRVEKNLLPEQKAAIAPAAPAPPAATDSPAFIHPVAPVLKPAKKDSVANGAKQSTLQDSIFIFW